MLPRGLLLRSPPVRLGRPPQPSAFEIGPDQRPLCLLLDDRAAGGDVYELLNELCNRPGVQATQEAADAPNRLTFTAPDDTANMLPFTITSAESVRYAGVPFYGDWQARAGRLTSSPSLTADQADAIRLAAVAAEIGVDALATADPLLLAHRDDRLLARANIRSLEETVALVGLFLRSRGDYVAWPEYGLTYGRSGFYWGLTRALLPAAWRWFSACVTSNHQVGPVRVLALGGGALRRVDRALRCRDRLHIEAAKPGARDAANEALFYLDGLLVALGGAFDAAARVAHIAYGLPASGLRRASWRSDRWRTALAQSAAELANLMAPESHGGDALELVATLRNCLHGEPLGLVTMAGGRSESRTLITIPAAEANAVTAVLNRYPPAESIGIERRAVGLAIKPEVLCEALIPWAIVSLDNLMAATDVTRLPSVTAEALRSGPPDHEESPWPGHFEPRTCQRLRLLAGI
jgi:hypothetical protein